MAREMVPIAEKYALTLDEAAQYYNIGVNKLRELTSRRDSSRCVLFVGNKRLIKRKAFEQYIETLDMV